MPLYEKLSSPIKFISKSLFLIERNLQSINLILVKIGYLVGHYIYTE